MEVSQKDARSSDGCRGEKEPSQIFVLPKNYREEERQSGMTREKQVSTGAYFVKDVGNVDVRLMQRRRQMRKHHKNRPGKNKNGGGLENKRYSRRLIKKNGGDNREKNKRALVKHKIHVYHGQIIEQNVCYGIAGVGGGIGIGVIRRDNGDKEQQEADKNSRDKTFLSPK